MIRRIDILLALTILCVQSTCLANSFGRTPGQFEVSSRGSAQYRIPIWTPPGIRGIQPNLSLTYDSQLSYGMIGPGWTLGGLSAITRCNRTYAQDGTPAPVALTMADAFCLDGNRLRLTSSETLSTYGEPGTTYQTEIANFSTVTAEGTAGNGPSYFEVKGKDGLTYEYGNTADSKILPSGSSATPYIWALDKVTDRSGNRMTFTYYQTGGAYVPLSIQYTAPDGSTSFPDKVSFGYTTKTIADTLTKYVSGTQIQQTQQLSTITATSSGTTVREYKLSYTTSGATLRATLTSIQECGGRAGTDCLPATSVGYQSGTAGVASPTTASGSGATNGTVYSADIDGDGKQDLVFAVSSGDNYEWWVQLATATGYAAPINTGAVTVGTTNFLLGAFDANGKTEILAPLSGTWYLYRLVGSSFTATSTRTSVVAGAYYCSADVDGDGRPDLVSVTSGTSVGVIDVSLQLNSNSAGYVTFDAALVRPMTIYTNTVTIGALYGNYQLTNSSVKHLDFDGDGRDDILLIAKLPTFKAIATVAIPILSRGTSTPALAAFGAGYTAGISQLTVANWNDDACTDLIVNDEVLLAPCNGSLQSSLQLPVSTGALLAIDWDGDGRTDALQDVGGVWQLYRSEGTAVAPTVSTGISAGTGTWFVTDKNGDGLDDLVFANASASKALYYGLHSGAGLKPDLASSFKDGYGNSVKPSYVPIAESNYSQNTDAPFPYLNYIGPLYVASEAVFSDPSNMPSGTYDQTYYYYGAWTNLQGRGFQAFETIKTTDSRYVSPNLLYDYQYFKTTFPWSAMRYQHLKSTGVFYPTQSVGTPNTLAQATLDGTANNERYFPYFTNWTTYQKEVDGPESGDLVTTTSTHYTYDNYGNATEVATTVTDDDPGSPFKGELWESTTASTIAPDTATWCLNLPTHVTVTNTSPTAAAITRTVAYTPDYTYCRQTQQVVEPSSATYKVTEGFAYDGFGNLETDTLTGIGMTPRSTQINWGTPGQFPLIVKNPLGQTIVRTYDPDTGRLLSQTDPNYTSTNPLITRWTYDDFARRTSEIRLDGTQTTWSYNNCATAGCVNSNNVMTVTRTDLQTDGRTVLHAKNVYQDSIDRTLVTSGMMLDGAFDRNEVQYDSFGNVHRQGSPCSFASCAQYWTTNTYDVLDRLIESQRPIGATNSTLQTTQIQYAGRTTKVTDAENITTSQINHVSGLLGETIDAYGYALTFYYDGFGSLESVFDNANQLGYQLFGAQYAYGIKPFQYSATYIDSGEWSYTYDALGELISWSDPNAEPFSQTYDALSRPLVRTERDLTTTWGWGNSAASYNIGKLAGVTAFGSSGGYSDTYSYDSKTRLSNEIINLAGTTDYFYYYTYSPTTGLPATLTYPTSTSSYALKLNYGFQNGFLSTVTDAASGTIYWHADATNPRGQVTQETIGNGVVTTRAYDAVTGWLSRVEAGVGGGAALQNSAYLYDDMGNVSQRQNNTLGLTEDFYYDHDYRLDHSTLNGALNLHVGYALNGNITSRSDVAGGASWTYDPFKIHRLTRAGSSADTYTYNADGDVASRNGHAFSWSTYNYPLEVSSANESVSFLYGPSRQRWKELYVGPGITEYTYRPDRRLEQVINGGVSDFRHYIYAGKELVAIYSRTSAGTNKVRYVIGDHQDSYSSIVSDKTPGPVADYVNESFTAYGNRRSAETWSGAPSSGDETAINKVSRRGYSGQTTLGVSMGLTHLNGRVADAITGRFLSPDPFVPDPQNTQSFNSYSYALNNPVTRIDPSGFDDQLDPITVICCSDSGSGSVLGDFFSDIAHFFEDLFGFGGGGPSLSPAQQAAVAHGISLSSPLQGNPDFQSVSGSASLETENATSTAATAVTAANASAAGSGVAAASGQPQTDVLPEGSMTQEMYYVETTNGRFIETAAPNLEENLTGVAAGSLSQIIVTAPAYPNTAICGTVIDCGPNFALFSPVLAKYDIGKIALQTVGIGAIGGGLLVGTVAVAPAVSGALADVSGALAANAKVGALSMSLFSETVGHFAPEAVQEALEAELSAGAAQEALVASAETGAEEFAEWDSYIYSLFQ